MNKLVVFLCTSCVSLQSIALASETSTRVLRPEKSQLRYEYLSKNKKFTFYGRVVDEVGKEIADANVSIDVRHYEQSLKYGIDRKVNTFSVNTDKNGVFQFTNYGCGLNIHTIHKSGFVYMPEKNQGNSLDFERNPTMPTKSNPALFCMRKKNEPVYVVQRSHVYKLREDGSRHVEFDLVNNWKTSTGVLLESVCEKEYKTTGITNKMHPIDFVLSATPINSNQYEIRCNCPDARSGVFISDEELYEAPEQGYAQSVSLIIDLKEPVTKYAYVCGRGGGVYSRIKLLMYVSNSHEFVFNTEMISNPTGDRNLELDSEFQLYERFWREEVTKEREQALLRARMDGKKFDETAFLANTLYKKNDFIANMKKKYEKIQHK